MNLLLLLSALLSALTGVNVGGVRTPVAQQVVQAGQAVVAVAVAPAAAQRPGQDVATIAARLTVMPLMRLPITTMPLYASRRRE